MNKYPKSERIIVIGSTNVDMVVKTDEHPLPGETRLGGIFFMNAGGKGANQAVAAARMGANVTFVTKVGNDIFGEQSIAGFKKEHINTDFVFVDDSSSTGTALIVVNKEGENSIVVAPGANARLLPRDIDKVHDFEEAGIILIQLEIPMETISAVVKKALVNNQKVILNPAPAQKLADELLDGLFLITPNETEASLLTGISVEDDDTAGEAARIFLKRGVKNVIITLGKKGAYFQNENVSLRINAPVVTAIDTTAAGDTFSGALAVALTEKMIWEEAIKFAAAAASISVTRLGAQASIPYRSEILS
jgi:ribokinase